MVPMRSDLFGDSIVDPVTLDSYAQHIQTHGYVAIPLVVDPSPIYKQLEKEVFTWKEFQFPREMKKLDDVPLFVGGGFSALGNPSSFHSKIVRELRLSLDTKIQFLWPYVVRQCRNTKQPWYKQQVVDRLMIRPKGASPTAESWHRDFSPGSGSDIILGGWINLSDVHQNFSCIPKSHLYARPDFQQKVTNKTGFLTLTSKEEKKRLKAMKKEVVVKPGCVLLFDQTIQHEVLSRKAKQVLLRLFVSFRLTSCLDRKFIVPECEMKDYFQKRSVPRLKSLQKPKMFPDAWHSFAVHKCKERRKQLASILHERAKDPKTNESMRFMPSLSEMGLVDEYITPKYTESEISIYCLKDTPFDLEPPPKKRCIRDL